MKLKKLQIGGLNSQYYKVLWGRRTQSLAYSEFRIACSERMFNKKTVRYAVYCQLCYMRNVLQLDTL